MKKINQPITREHLECNLVLTNLDNYYLIISLEKYFATLYNIKKNKTYSQGYSILDLLYQLNNTAGWFLFEV